MVAVDARCVRGKPSKSASCVTVIGLVRKVAKPNQVGRYGKWKEDGKSDEKYLVYPCCTNLPYEQDVWVFLSFI